VLGAAFVLGASVLLYVGLPSLAGIDDTLARLRHGDAWWLGLGVLFEILSYCGYVLLFRGVFSASAPALGWRTSYRITMAGVAATRLFAAGGAGGIALTVWALHGLGVAARRVASSVTAFLVLLYAVFMLALVLGGAGLRSGVLPGPAPFGLTVVPAVFAATVIALVLVFAAVPGDLERRVTRGRLSDGRRARVARAVASAPAAIGAGVRTSLALARTGDPRLLGAIAWWAFDVAVLWAALSAFGDAPPVAVVVMAYFVGMLGNLLPLPGGVGGVDGGMIAALVGFGVAADLAVVGVLAYRAIAFWLPTVPGAVAYLQLLKQVRARRSTHAAA
jgi:uncharacterized membrane protein YbhN (UPF0104 family)